MKRALLVGIGVVVLIGGVLLIGAQILERRARKQEDAWKSFVEYWEGKGESFAISSPAPLSAADEFIENPWIKQVIAGDPIALERLESMSPFHVEGYETWVSEADEESIPKPMPPELARRIRDHGNEFKSEMDAFTEAIRRKGFFLGKIDPMNPFAPTAWVAKLSPIGNLLTAMASAAAADGNLVEFTGLVEILLQAGNKFRRSDDQLSVVVGSGFEKCAYQTLGSLQNPESWPHEERLKWLDALDYRKRPLAEEWAAVLRQLRGKYLKMLESMENNPAVKIPGISNFAPVRRGFFATTKLACCESLQEIVLAPRGVVVSSVDASQIVKLDGELKRRYRNPNSAEGLGLLPYLPQRGIFESLLFTEDERGAARKRIMDAGSPLK